MPQVTATVSWLHGPPELRVYTDGHWNVIADSPHDAAEVFRERFDAEYTDETGRSASHWLPLDDDKPCCLHEDGETKWVPAIKAAKHYGRGYIGVTREA